MLLESNGFRAFRVTTNSMELLTFEAVLLGAAREHLESKVMLQGLKMKHIDLLRVQLLGWRPSLVGCTMK